MEGGDGGGARERPLPLLDLFKFLFHPVHVIVSRDVDEVKMANAMEDCESNRINAYYHCILWAISEKKPQFWRVGERHSLGRSKIRESGASFVMLKKFWTTQPSSPGKEKLR